MRQDALADAAEQPAGGPAILASDDDEVCSDARCGCQDHIGGVAVVGDQIELGPGGTKRTGPVVADQLRRPFLRMLVQRIALGVVAGERGKVLERMNRSDVGVFEMARCPCCGTRGAREAIEADYDALNERLSGRKVNRRHDDDGTAARAGDRVHRRTDGQRGETACSAPAQNDDISVEVRRRLHDRGRGMALTDYDVFNTIIFGGDVVTAHRDVHDHHVCVTFACEPCRPRHGTGGRKRAVIAHQDQAHDVPPLRASEPTPARRFRGSHWPSVRPGQHGRLGLLGAGTRSRRMCPVIASAIRGCLSRRRHHVRAVRNLFLGVDGADRAHIRLVARRARGAFIDVDVEKRVDEDGDHVRVGCVRVLHHAAAGLLLGEEDVGRRVVLVDALDRAHIDARPVLYIKAGQSLHNSRGGSLSTFDRAR